MREFEALPGVSGSGFGRKNLAGIACSIASATGLNPEPSKVQDLNPRILEATHHESQKFPLAVQD